MEEKVAKYTFDELWSSKQCGEVGNALHLAIKTNLPFMTIGHHAPFYKFAPICCKYHVKLAKKKHKASLESQDLSHITLVEPSNAQTYEMLKLLLAFVRCQCSCTNRSEQKESAKFICDLM